MALQLQVSLAGPLILATGLTRHKMFLKLIKPALAIPQMLVAISHLLPNFLFKSSHN